MAEIEAIFERCLQKLETGASLEDSLSGNAAEQAEIASLLQIAAALRSLASPVPARSEQAYQAPRSAFLAAAGAFGAAEPAPDEVALADSLAMLAEGATVDDCAAAFPRNAAELRVSLDVVNALQAAAQPAPQRTASQIASERAAFLASAREYAGRQNKPGWLAGALAGLAVLFRQPVWRAVAVVFLLLATFFGLGGTALTVASNALPGDALYPVKLAAERARVAVTVDERERAQLLEIFDQRRRQEVVDVVDAGRQIEVQFPGTIQSMLDGMWTISGMALPVFVPGDAEVIGVPAVGRQVLVTAYSDGQGRLIAGRVVVFGGDGAAAPTPTATATATGTPVRAILAPERSTATATARPRPTDTTVTRPTATATLTATPVITATAALTTVLTATPTATASGTPAVSPTPTATLAPYPGSHFGLIEEIHPTWWSVGGRRILLTPDTQIDESMGPAEVGAEVAIEGIIMPDPPAFVATLIRVTSSVYETREWTGTIQSMSGDIWVVGNTTVDVSDASISGTPAVGKVASVRARRRANQMWQATSVSVQEVEYVYVFGTIQSISGDIWVVAGQTVNVAGAQFSGDPPAVGLYAEIEAISTGGQLRAVRVNVVGPTSTPTSTPVATPTPTGTPAATPTPTGTPAATPTPTGTPAATPTPTGTPGATPTPTDTPAATATSTETPGATATPTPAAGSPTATPTTAPPTATFTPEPPTATPTEPPPIPTNTPTTPAAPPTSTPPPVSTPTEVPPPPTATYTPVPTLPFTPPPPPTLEALAIN
ncbi:MAG: DUF5666 domain-containing protein [Caldilineales bacterium]